jgi:hypothetical protein
MCVTYTFTLVQLGDMSPVALVVMSVPSWICNISTSKALHVKPWSHTLIVVKAVLVKVITGSIETGVRITKYGQEC